MFCLLIKIKKKFLNPYLLDSLKDISFKHKEEISNQYISEHRNQEFFIPTWWQLEVTKNYDVADLSFGEWYRIFLSDPEEGERNEEWVAPDEHYNSIEILQNFSNFFSSRILDSKVSELDLPFSPPLSPFREKGRGSIFDATPSHPGGEKGFHYKSTKVRGKKSKFE